MSISSLNGALGFATQAASGSAASYRYNPALVAPTDYKWHAATDIDFGTVQDQRAAPIEVNSEMVPLGGYKAMAYVAGGATINPRLDEAAGTLLLNALGYAASDKAVNEDTLMAPMALTAGSVSGAGVLVAGAAAAVVGKTAVLTLMSSDNISAFSDTDFTLTGGSAGEDIPVASFIGKGAQFAHVPAAAPLAGTVTAIVVPQFTAPVGTKVKASIGWYSATAKEHKFTFDPTNKSNIGWMTVRKLVPKPATGAPGNTFGEEGIDCRLANFRLNVPANGVVSARVDWQGREPRLYDNPAWTPSYSDFSSVPISCVLEGGIVIPGFSTDELPITNMSLTMSNNTTQPQQEMVIGSYFPDDFVPLSRAATITATYKWANADLYRAILTGSIAGTAWSPKPWYSPFYARVAAPDTCLDGITKYSLTTFAPRVMWSVAAPPALAGGDLVMLQLQGTVMKPSVATQNYLEVSLVNDIVSYLFA